MRIFFVSQNTPNEKGLPDSQLWYSNLYLTLVGMGHDLVTFDHDYLHLAYDLDLHKPAHREVISLHRPAVSKRLIEEVTNVHKSNSVDLLFTYFSSSHVEPEAIRAIHDLGIITLNWYCNASYQFHNISGIASSYDWCLVPEKHRLNDYKMAGARPIYCQEAANPDVYKPYKVPVEYDVTFVGQAYGERPSYIRYLIDKSVHVNVWGVGWRRFVLSSPNKGHGHELFSRKVSAIIGKLFRNNEKYYSLLNKLNHNYKSFFKLYQEKTPLNGNSVKVPNFVVGEPLSDVEMIKMYSRSKINLGFSTCAGKDENGRRVTQVRLRDFEVPMCGGFYLVEYMEELEEFYNIGEEIVCYTCPEDLVEKIKYYLKHDEKREAIRRAGYERCRRDHTWKKRFEMAFKQMGLI